MRKITDTVKDLQGELECASIDTAIAVLERCKQEYSSKYFNLRLEIDYRYDYGDSIQLEVYLRGERDETDEERIAREGVEHRVKELQKQQELKQLAILRAKYEQGE